jgi:regulator of sigma E protease
LSMILYWFIFMVGFATVMPITGDIISHSIAAQAGLTSQQKIIQVDQLPVRDWLSTTIAVFYRLGDKNLLQITAQDLKTQLIQDYFLDLKSWKLDSLKPDPIRSLGINPFKPESPALIDKIVSHSVADRASLKIGDVILKVNQQTVLNWEHLTRMIRAQSNQTIQLTIQRQGKIFQKNIFIPERSFLFFKKPGVLGVISHQTVPAQWIVPNKYSVSGALHRAQQESQQFFKFNFVVLKKLVMGNISLRSLAGPFAILSNAGAALDQGLMVFLNFLAFISISVAAVNVLPLPGLDGGYLLYFLIEGIIKKPISIRTQALLSRLGLIVILMVLVQTLLNDILRML